MIIIKPPLLTEASFSRVVLDREGELMRMSLSLDQKYRLYVPLTDISPKLIQIILLYEDQYFYSHIGINLSSLLNAFVKTYITGNRKVGGSTITMQVARIKFAINSKNIIGKLWQIIKAIHLELHYTKNEILEAYLNLVPYGGNIEGVGAASYIYFRRPVKDLNIIDSVTLAIIPQHPVKRSPQSNGTFNTEQIMLTRKRLFNRWVQVHLEDKVYEKLLHLPITFNSTKELPFLSPQFTLSLLANYSSNIISSTLDKDLQITLEKQITNYVNSYSNYGIRNSAALLIDFINMEVLASVGSADFFNSSIDGQVDGTRAKRSPGSTLKPFVYALAFDQGLIHPLTVLQDLPRQYGNYLAENFDSKFMGPISVRESLIKSRNIPVLYLASQLNYPTFYDFLRSANITKLKAFPYYGLTMALGSVEVTMEELVKLYAMLANLGVYQNLSKIRDNNISSQFQEMATGAHKEQKQYNSQTYISTRSPSLQGEGGTIKPKVRLLSKEASYLTLDILKDIGQPGFNYNMANLNSRLPVYWKTGTSSSFRDSWAIGIFGKYVLAVWVGDFKGNTRGTFIGVKTAAPLFFNIINAIVDKKASEDLLLNKYPELKITKVAVCADTGEVNNNSCLVKAITWFIPGVSPIKPTGIYQKIVLPTTNIPRVELAPSREGEGVLSPQTAGRPESSEDPRTGIFRQFPAEVSCEKSLLSKEPNILGKEEDDHTPLAVSYKKLEITSPLKNVIYSLKNNNQIIFSANTDSRAKEIFWFVDNKLIGRTTPNQPLSWTAKPGKMVLRAVDNNGASDTQLIITSN